MTSDHDERRNLTVLQVRDGHSATKTFGLDAAGQLDLRSSYDAGYRFHVVHSRCLDERVQCIPSCALAPKSLQHMHAILDELTARWDLLVIRAELRIELPSLDATVLRRHRPHPDDTGLPPFAPADRHWFMFDVDSVEEPDLSMSEIGRAASVLVARYMHELQGRRMLVRPSASAGIKPGLRMHMLAWFERAHSDSAYAGLCRRINQRAGKSIVDAALARAVQPHYTAAPIFVEGAIDPMSSRLWSAIHV